MAALYKTYRKDSSSLELWKKKTFQKELKGNLEIMRLTFDYIFLFIYFF